MSAAIDAVLYGFLYVLIGVLFTKGYKVFFHGSYNFLNWAWNDQDTNGSTEYDNNKKYPENAYWFAVLIYPLIATWVIVSCPVKLFNKLVKAFLDVEEENQ